MWEFLLKYGYIIFTALLLPAMIFAIWAQSRVTKVFNTFKKVPSQNGKTAAEVAKEMLQNAGISDVEVVKINGNLTDNFDPRTKKVSLSEEVYDSTSVGSIGVAAHEVGHAIQNHTNYFPLKLRLFTIKLCNFSSSMLIPLIIISIITFSLIPFISMGIILFAILSFVLSFLISIITLPVEYNASNRAVAILSKNAILTPTETNQSKTVLSAAALTYVASTLISLLNFLRILFYFLGIFGGGKNKN